MVFDKTILQKGTGLYCPNKLGEAVVDVTGKWTASDGDFVFDRQDNRSIILGELYLEREHFMHIHHAVTLMHEQETYVAYAIY